MTSPRKTALVTGANKGIGLEAVIELAEAGFQVFLTARSKERGTKSAGKMTDRGLDVTFLPLDVADPRSIETCARKLESRIDHLDVLVNNAGIYIDSDASILDLDEETLTNTLRTNTIGPLQVAQKLWPLLAKSESGRIINVSSGLGQLGDMEGDTPAYSISKTALNAVTRQLAYVLGSHAIAVNAVCPGWVRTDMGTSAAPRSVEEGADTIVWLATDAPPNLTGHLLRDREPIPW